MIARFARVALTQVQTLAAVGCVRGAVALLDLSEKIAPPSHVREASRALDAAFEEWFGKREALTPFGLGRGVFAATVMGIA